MEWDDEDDDEEEDDGEGGGGGQPPKKKTTAQKLTQFYAPKTSETNMQAAVPIQSRYAYFKAHQMHVVTSFGE